jgi:hypothetical protein
MLFRQTAAVYCVNHTEHINTLCGQSAESFSVEAGGTYSNHCAVTEPVNVESNRRDSKYSGREMPLNFTPISPQAVLHEFIDQFLVDRLASKQEPLREGFYENANTCKTGLRV